MTILEKRKLKGKARVLGEEVRGWKNHCYLLKIWGKGGDYSKYGVDRMVG